VTFPRTAAATLEAATLGPTAAAMALAEASVGRATSLFHPASLAAAALTEEPTSRRAAVRSELTVLRRLDDEAVAEECRGTREAPVGTAGTDEEEANDDDARVEEEDRRCGRLETDSPADDAAGGEKVGEEEAGGDDEALLLLVPFACANAAPRNPISEFVDAEAAGFAAEDFARLLALRWDLSSLLDASNGDAGVEKDALFAEAGPIDIPLRPFVRE
jgi:hypothetical protein